MSENASAWLLFSLVCVLALFIFLAFRPLKLKPSETVDDVERDGRARGRCEVKGGIPLPASYRVPMERCEFPPAPCRCAEAMR